jgi:hypothetical protein
MSTAERVLGGAEIEVTAKATRRRFTLDYKRKIVQEAGRCKRPPGRWERCCAGRGCTRRT